ncbi:cytochrome c-type biogenesis protein CcmH [Bartonella henselae]|uniref:cytochrome c-type biogenesis protein n=1 Tax=Bartonella henselae TaxID=38323 RepID=UPI000959ACA9|nr:cytochrome c-type biogenesis protein [Bartonella henselae]OLL54007.1 cytochrome C biogenesis protein cycl [Bartonella henselae]OLL54307.1 cytochrome C biogenesis protein cycl [Bartonella henselae]UJM32846.1 cytochrome c-type biogenesis protein CcmH [Bartonella henselae]
MKKKLFCTLFFFIIVFSLSLAMAVEPDEVLKDTVLEARARDISLHLRCPVCQNQSIDDSDALLARDLRLLIRERLKMGESNQQVIDFLVERYGDFILLKPPFNKTTWFLWLSPLIIIIIGASAIFFQIKWYKNEKVITLNASEEK